MHRVPARFFEREVNISLAGCGGNGCHMLMGLSQMNLALKELQHPGIHVVAYDPDTVSHANLGRQMFTPSEVGQNKAVTLVNRLNMAFGSSWTACPTVMRRPKEPDIVISCVDSKEARKGIMRLLESASLHYWMDLGNGPSFGQVVIGQHGVGRRQLPHVLELYPALVEGPEDTTPSCSLAEALEHQDLFINRTLSAFALHQLWTIFRKGLIQHAGCFLNLESLETRPIPLKTLREHRAHA